MLTDAVKPTASCPDRLSLWRIDMKLTHFAEFAPLFALLALVGTEVRAESTDVLRTHSATAYMMI